MTFDPDDPNLTAFALGELDDADRLAVESLLARSPEAARFVAEVRETAALLSGTLRKEPMPGLSIVQRLDLDARLGTVPVPSSTPRRVPVPRALFAVAASVLLTMSGFGIGVLVANRGQATGDRAVAFTPSARPGSIGSAVEAELELSEPSAEGSAEAPAPELDAAPQAVMMDQADSVAEDEVRNPEAEMLAMEAVPLESPEQGFARSVPSRLKAREPRVPATAAAPSEDAMPDQAEAAAKVALEDGLEVRGGGFGGLGSAGRTLDPPEAVPAIRQPEPSMVPPPAPLAEDDAGRAGLDRVRTNRPTAVVGTRGVDRRAGSNPSQAVTVQPGNVVEVVNLPERTIAQRFALGEPIREVLVDPTGELLLASTADRGVSVFDVETGALVQAIRVDQGPMPSARLGKGGELILSNRVAEIGQEPDGPISPSLWFSADRDPVALVQQAPRDRSLVEVVRSIMTGELPTGSGFPIDALVNAAGGVPFFPAEGAPLTEDGQVVPAPWNARNRLVRLTLIARPVGPNESTENPPVVAEDLRVEVVFNPDRVRAYRPIGPEGKIVAGPIANEGGTPLRAGEVRTVIFEIEPMESPDVADRLARERENRAMAPFPGIEEERSLELLSVRRTYREPIEGEFRSFDDPVREGPNALADAPDHVRLTSALAWLGLVLRGELRARPETLEGIAELLESSGGSLQPEERQALRELIGWAEQREQARSEPRDDSQ